MRSPFSIRKYLFVVTAALCWCLPSNAQLTLNQPNTTGTYTDPVSITLAPGFHSTGNFHAFIGTSSSGVLSNYNYIHAITYKTASTTVPSSFTTANSIQEVQYFDGLGRPMQSIVINGSAGTKDLVTHQTYDDLGRPYRQYLPYVASTVGGAYKTDGATAAVSYYQGTHAGVVQTPYPYSQPVYEPSPLNRIAQQGAPGAAWQPYNTGISGSGHTQKADYATNAASTIRLWTLTGNGASGTAYYPAGDLLLTVSKDENWTTGKIGTAEEYTDKRGAVVAKRVWQTESTARITYYVYDAWGGLLYVIPPGFTATSFTEADANFSRYIYAYKYDGLRRVTEKKIPGKGWEEMVYNKLDQLVLSRDAKMKAANQWLFSKYDTLGRTVVTGLISSSATRASWQTMFNGQTQNCEARDNGNASGTGMGYTNNVHPKTGISAYYTITYYDDYAFHSNTHGNPTGSQRTQVRGLQTGVRVNTLGTSTRLLTNTYYDTEGRVVQTKTQNHLGGTDVVTTTYNFPGDVVKTSRTHTMSSVSTLVETRYDYDHLRRRTDTYQKTGNASSTEVLLSRQEYNGVGQLYQRKLHRLSGSTFAQTVTHGYNERGWLRTGNAGLFLQLELRYNTGTTPQYNGNVANQLWTTAGQTAKSYTYTYDRLNRLTAATAGTGTPASYTENGITYDAMGNITALKRGSAAVQTYSYTDGNRLTSVSGGITRSYTYDVNGNALTDGTNTFTYNVLNLPATVTGTNASTYTYDATGKKLTRTKGGIATHYADGIRYTGNTIDFVQTEAGIARRVNATTYAYEYNLTDHLGNVRVTFDIDGTTARRIQSDDYHAFGKRISVGAISGTENHYLYNGKELQAGLDRYDYGARLYDPVIGRWGSVDPMADKYYTLSPFTYVANNPINAIDPDGKRIFWVGGAGNDQIGWNYTSMWQRAVTDGGIGGFTRINASHDNPISLRNGSTPTGDIYFTSSARSSSYQLTPIYNRSDPLGSARGIYNKRIPVQDAQIDKAYGAILSNIQDSPLAEGEQFNLMGYSYGAVLQAHVALRLANAGHKIDNLVLIGSPISTKSELYKSLTSNKNIRQVLRYDIPGDKLSNPKNILEFIQGSRQNSDPNNTGEGPHYDLARPGDDTYDRIRNVVVEWLRQQGVQ
ncbi:RHS repeat-associated core domain-containing protein [Parapedobacter tibetensis]|uniref:RHS repeat-associated core domain-containing protein n=1 Tax=Parapedobacter tibetensis TaxID=2972951 RepID=UPI00214D1F0D|nr:RHS repeat-associated core domain-containing protein [Parapedobacter tibetensis]